MPEDLLGVVAKGFYSPTLRVLIPFVFLFDDCVPTLVQIIAKATLYVIDRFFKIVKSQYCYCFHFIDPQLKWRGNFHLNVAFQFDSSHVAALIIAQYTILDLTAILISIVFACL